jgi:hypothetical protein
MTDAATFLQAVFIIGLLSMVAICLAAAIRNHWKKPSWF